MKKLLLFLISFILIIGNLISGDFTLMVIPDSQFYIVSYTSGGGTTPNPSYFTNQVKWIADNISPLNIAFVSHMGDVVDHGQNQWEWDLAKTAMFQLDGKVPYGICPGNHDAQVMWQHTYPLFNSNFPVSKFQGQPWYGGNYPVNENTNNYELFSGGGLDFIIIHLASDPQADVRAWASSVLDKYPNRRAIISTHWYLTGIVDTPGQNIWNDVVKNHRNVFLVLCGHACNRELTVKSINNFGDTIPQILTDYQCDPSGGNGQLRYYTFHTDKNSIEAFTYSTQSKQYGTHFSWYYKMTGAVKTGYNNNINIDETPLKIYPNPAENILNIEGDNILGISIYSLNGKEIESYGIKAISYSMDIGLLAKGIYILKVKTLNGDVIKKFVKS